MEDDGFHTAVDGGILRRIITKAAPGAPPARAAPRLYINNFPTDARLGTTAAATGKGKLAAAPLQLAAAAAEAPRQTFEPVVTCAEINAVTYGKMHRVDGGASEI